MGLDPNSAGGGSSLTVAGTLTNTGGLAIGNSGISAPDTVAAASLDNTGSINLSGSGNQALLDVTTGSAGFGAAGTLTGSVVLNYFDSAIEFAQRADQHDRRQFIVVPLREQRLHRGQHGARLEQRPDRACQRRGHSRSLGRRNGVDDRRARQ